jgi:hypothetical protein
VVSYTIGGKDVCFVRRIKSRAVANDKQVANKFDVHFLKRSHRSDNTFIDCLPLDQASGDVDEVDILPCLPDTAVRRGIYTFGFDISVYKLE